ncbi:hypothetical protein [Daejeonella sp. JGW-45]|uniref:hypothetical protein n=1 Tax=Daejeonella sp. JGW-45 TaxID=3034148 RepID=UPI0023EDD536|nr:hypothetical protein [Daejeonella sp. JGW-45]
MNKSKMKTIKSIALAFSLLIAGSTISYAQTGGHAHKAPHGGMIQTAGKYHIEMVKGADNIRFYLLDTKEKTVLNKGVKGTVVFEFANKTKATAPLNIGDESAFLVNNPRASIFAYCTVSFNVKGKNVSAKFKNDVPQAVLEHGHEH